MAVLDGVSLFVDWDGDGDWGDMHEDVTQYVRSIVTSTGRDLSPAQLLGIASPGRLIALLNNTSDLFSPFNSGGDLFGLLKPGRLVRLVDGAEVRWIGRLSSLVPDVQLGPLKMARLEAVGWLAEAARQRILPLVSAGGELTGDLITAALEAVNPEYDTSGIEVGQITTGPFGTAGNNDAPLLDEVRTLEAAEFGLLHEDVATYRPLYHDRAHRPAVTTPAATFSDDPAESLRYRRVTERDWSQQIFNRATAGVSPWSVGSQQVLYTDEGPHTLAESESQQFVAQYNGPVLEWTSWRADVTGQADDGPVVEGFAASVFGSNTTAHSTSVPATPSAGELILVVGHFVKSTSALPNPIVTTPSGYTKLEHFSTNIWPGIRRRTWFCYGKVAAGGESSVALTTNVACSGAAHVYVISNWYGTLPGGVHVGFPASSQTAVPAVDTETAPWGEDFYLGIGAAAWPVNDAPSGAPSGWTDLTGAFQNLGDDGDNYFASVRRSVSGTDVISGANFPGVASMSIATRMTVIVRPQGMSTEVLGEFDDTRLGTFTIEYEDGLGGTSQSWENIEATGQPLDEGAAVSVEANYAASQDSLSGVGIRSYKGPALFAAAEDAQAFADLVVGRFGEGLPIMALEYSALRDSNHRDAAKALNVGDRITLEAENETGLGIGEDFFIEHVDLDIAVSPARYDVVYELSPASVTDP